MVLYALYTRLDLTSGDGTPNLVCVRSRMAGHGCSGGGEEGGCGDCGAKAASKPVPKACTKCGGKPQCCPRGKILCIPCVVQNMQKSIRNSLTRTRSSVPQEHLLVAFSGDGASLVMTLLVREARDALKGHKYGLTVAHVDETGSLDMCPDQAEEHQKRVAVAAAACGVDKLEILRLTVEDHEILSKCRETGAGLTAWHDSKEAMRVKKLTEFAVSRGCTRLLMGDTASLLAARVISDLSKNMPLDTRRYEVRQAIEGVPQCEIIRPFHDALSEEIALFIRHFRLPAAILPLKAWTGPTSGADSLNSLCREFVACLQANKKASVPTILRSIAKIIPSSASTTQCPPSVDGHGRGTQGLEQECARQHAKEGDKGGRRRGGTCDRCGIERAAVKRPKDGARVCKACFYELFEDEVHQTIVDGKLFSPGESVCVAASGGKDSTVLAEMMTVLNKRHNYGLKLFLLSIDEGISGYRDDSLETVKRNQVEYNLPLTILSYKDLYGWTMDEIVSHIGTTSNCTFCGVFRRQALDRGAALLKADKIVTGHNADDVAETVLLNILRGDVARLQRCTAVTTGSDGSIPRSKPFKFTYEKEIVMYAHFKRLDYFSTECLYSPHAYRGFAREFLKSLERSNPATILDIIRSGERCVVNTSSCVMPTQGTCLRCGYISSQALCKACVLLDDLHNRREKRKVAIEYES